MNILVVSATEQEIAPFLARHPAADHLITGVGTTCTAYHLTRRLRQMDYDMVIQAGIAGAFGNKPPGEVFSVKRDGFAGAGVLENGVQFSLFEKELWRDDHPFQQGWLVNDGGIEKYGLPVSDAITVDMVTNDEVINRRIFEKFHPAELESMEGAAFHFVCLMEEMNFLQIRAVSNKVGERDKSLWKMEEAIAALNRELDRIYNELTVEQMNYDERN